MKTHIQIASGPSNARAIVCGSPERAQWFASLLESSRPVARNREYHSYLGRHEGAEILVLSHGIGSAGAAICFQELIDAGARSVIRIGTAGGLADGMSIADIVVPTCAIRRDGVSALMVPPGYPATPDLGLTLGVIEALERGKIPARHGLILTSDLFYPGKLDPELQSSRDAGAVAVEMECSTLFVVSRLRGVKSAALLVTDGNPLGGSPDDYDPRPERLQSSLEKCFRAAVDALARDAGQPSR